MNDAYAAGLIDGEGCISIDKKLTLRIDVGMTEKALPILRSLEREYGGKVRKFREATDKWEAAWTWTITGKHSVPMLERLLPHLHLKWEQATLALRVQALRDEMPIGKYRRPAWTPELRERGERIRSELMRLNRKGPTPKPSTTGTDTPFARLVDGEWVTPQRSLFSDLGYEVFSGPWPKSGFMTSPGECWTVDTSECPNGGDGFSSLPDVLEATVPERFFLSPKAAAGILRRAAKRGRELPKHLHAALQNLASQHRDEGRRTT